MFSIAFDRNGNRGGLSFVQLRYVGSDGITLKFECTDLESILSLESFEVGKIKFSEVPIDECSIEWNQKEIKFVCAIWEHNGYDMTFSIPNTPELSKSLQDALKAWVDVCKP